MRSILSISEVSKTYATGFKALKEVNLDIERGEIFALLGPNGAGKTTLISIVCGIVNRSSGTRDVDGHDINRDYRAARSLIGLVPQELTIDAFETVWATVNYSRGLFGKPANQAFVEKVLRDLSLWDKKDAKSITLSGGMKRRRDDRQGAVARAAGAVPRRADCRRRRRAAPGHVGDGAPAARGGVTIILTTHYIEEAEAMADRVGVINRGEIILVEDKAELMRKLGRKQLVLELRGPLAAIPPKPCRTMRWSYRRMADS